MCPMLAQLQCRTMNLIDKAHYLAGRRTVEEEVLVHAQVAGRELPDRRSAAQSLGGREPSVKIK